ncbi:hypothetical protein HPP92_028761 [Vanilla planifolia]|uniref:Uncharacterized protein n=1 Tax=Vanilla planifolia TaxID=51239 RepID=A0A835P657_VANPL|nr:hypothetical protein HPP92_028761 [Vanilla planifolia]KAG0446606.1 hypothetical protein HPP92_028747 [Vanilla planifolia]
MGEKDTTMKKQVMSISLSDPAVRQPVQEWIKVFLLRRCIRISFVHDETIPPDADSYAIAAVNRGFYIYGSRRR